MHAEQRQGRQGQWEREKPVVAEMRDCGTGQHKSQRASYCQHGGQQPDPAGNPP
jgi:hypothetical protein